MLVSYWLPQFAGAALAGWLLYSFAGDVSGGATIGSLSKPETLAAGGIMAAVLATSVEIILTFFLVNTILHTAIGGKGGPLAGWAIGTTLAVAILAGGPLTGASLNPARTFGTALFSAPSLGLSNTYVIYLFGPLIGSTLAVIAYNFFSSEEPKPLEMPVPEPKPEVHPARTERGIGAMPDVPPQTRPPRKKAATAKKSRKK